MTGPYLSFKGKLKVGDRVTSVRGKPNACQNLEPDGESTALITHVDEETFGIGSCTHSFENNIAWLELLSPSPRVVTLESLEKGDEIKNFDGAMRKVESVTKDEKLVILSARYGPDSDCVDYEEAAAFDEMRAYTLEGLKSLGYEPVQPASPPAPAEEEWWHDEKYWEEEDTSEIEAMSYPRIAEIVAEAMRRGAEEAWKEARSIVQRKLDECLSDTAESCYELLLTEFPNEEALNKPVTNGEK